MPALNVMTTCDTLASSASRIVCIRSCESGRAGLCPMSAPWMDSATSESTKTGIALLPTLSSTTGPAWDSRTSIFWTRISAVLFDPSSASADAPASENATPAHTMRDSPSLPMASSSRPCCSPSYRDASRSAACAILRQGGKMSQGLLLFAAILVSVIGAMHSFLGERYVFGRLFALPDLPLLRRDRRYAE